MPRPSRLSIELLETFASVVEQGGDATLAALALEINQPSMSKRLAQLQDAGTTIRSPWIERRGKRWALTAEGQRVLPTVREIVSRYRALADFSGGLRGAPCVTVACGQHAATTYVAEALRRFRRERPDSRFRVSTLRGRSRIEGVANGALDLAIVSHPESEIEAIARRPLHVDPLRDDPLVLVASRSARAPWRPDFDTLPDASVTADMLFRLPLLLPEPDAGVRQNLDRDLMEAGVSGKLRVVMEVGGWSTILAFVRDGVGVGLVSSSACVGVRDLSPPRPLDPAQFRPIRLSLIARKHLQGDEHADLSEDAECFRDQLLRTCREWPVE